MYSTFIRCLLTILTLVAYILVIKSALSDIFCSLFEKNWLCTWRQVNTSGLTTAGNGGMSAFDYEGFELSGTIELMGAGLILYWGIIRAKTWSRQWPGRHFGLPGLFALKNARGGWWFPGRLLPAFRCLGGGYSESNSLILSTSSETEE